VNTAAWSEALLTDTVDETGDHARVPDMLVSVFHSQLQDAS
jgi:hypothetical protein